MRSMTDVALPILSATCWFRLWAWAWCVAGPSTKPTLRKPGTGSHALTRENIQVNKWCLRQRCIPQDLLFVLNNPSHVDTSPYGLYVPSFQILMLPFMLIDKVFVLLFLHRIYCNCRNFHPWLNFVNFAISVLWKLVMGELYHHILYDASVDIHWNFCENKSLEMSFGKTMKIITGEVLYDCSTCAQAHANVK